MTVAELIAVLSQHPPEMKVFVLVADVDGVDGAEEANAVEVTAGYGARERGVLIRSE